MYNFAKAWTLVNRHSKLNQHVKSKDYFDKEDHEILEEVVHGSIIRGHGIEIVYIQKYSSYDFLLLSLQLKSCNNLSSSMGSPFNLGSTRLAHLNQPLY